MSELKALNSFVVVEEIEEKSEGAIVYEIKKDYSRAKVVSVGAKVEDIKKDDIVYFAKDCLKLKFDNNVWGIDSKYIIAKD